ncbi:hemagglutinin [Enterococcus ureilyticus]|uniref:Hemagglutinin n=4 Tax=Enterococcus ureilyticus TaxID=1131292 RepID=A0A1E5HC82_9ENTE|nr:hemagglutinin [Enterococcus ureilyticus]
MKEFFETDFGSEIKGNITKTNKKYQGQSVYKVDKKIGNLKKNDQIYLDGLHKDHLEVFDSNGNLRTILNLDGTVNLDKYGKAVGRTLK